jgi:NAD(P)-dependent dehydrogenase (short-subunit alcohol dehydrogenase family)
MLRNQQRPPKICPDDFQDRLVVITGATSGIGYAAAEKFASQGADILTVNRSEAKSRELCQNLEKQHSINCDYLLADFSRLDQIHATARELSALEKDIDVLIHNAGVFNTEKIMTDDSLEMVFQVNYLSTFIYNYYLREKFLKQGDGRILFVNSEAHRFAVWGLNLDDLTWEKHRYSGLKSYGSAKMAQLLSLIKFSEIFQRSDVTINAMHPGNVRTRSGQNNGPIYRFLKRILVDSTAKTARISAEALYYLGVSREVENLSGKFFNLTTEEEPAPPALDREAAQELWTLSLKMSDLS